MHACLYCVPASAGLVQRFHYSPASRQKAKISEPANASGFWCFFPLSAYWHYLGFTKTQSCLASLYILYYMIKVYICGQNWFYYIFFSFFVMIIHFDVLTVFKLKFCLKCVCVCTPALDGKAFYWTCGLRVPLSLIFLLLFFVDFFQLVMDDRGAGVSTSTLHPSVF